MPALRTLAACVVLALAVAGCGSKPSAAPAPASPVGGSTTPAQTSAPGSPTASPTATPTSPPTSPTTTTTTTTTISIGRALAVDVPRGWVVERSPIARRSGSVCLQPKGSTRTVFECAGVAFYFGPHLPGAHTDPYAPDQPDGWYPATDVELCPFVPHRPTDTTIAGIRTTPGVARGLRPVGAHRADWNRWNASCAGRSFHPQAWFLPTSHVVAFDYLGHRETASILRSAVFAKDGAELPAPPTYVSAHVLSVTGTSLVVQPFHTYTTGAAAQAFAAAHGLQFPFPDDDYDADTGPRRTIAADASTDCVGGLDLEQDVTGAPVPCSAFGAQQVHVPAGIWLRPATSTAESVTEIFRP